MSDPVLMVTISCPPEQAEALAGGLVERRLAACVSILPGVRSVYRWQGAIQQDTEALLMVKTTHRQLAPLRDWVLAHHPYSLPEIVAVPVTDGHAAYLDWVRTETLG